MACPAGTHFLPVSPTLDDVRCHRPAIFLHDFDRFGRWFLECFLGYMPGFHFGFAVGLLPGSAGFLTCTDGQILFAVYLGLACRPSDINLPFGLSVARGTPILAGGIGVARPVAGACFVLICFVWAS